MGEQLRRSRRILDVQSQLDKLADWKLIDLQTQATILKNQQRDLIHFLSEESEVSGFFSSTMIRRLQTIADKLTTLGIELESQRSRHLAERKRLRCAERTFAIYERDEWHKKILCQLVEAIETAQQRRS